MRGLRQHTWLPASFMLALAVVYLFHSVVHASQAVVPFQAGDHTVLTTYDSFVMNASRTGEGIVGCHFFCNGGCPIPPVVANAIQHTAVLPRLIFERLPNRPVRCVHPQPEKAPPRFLA